MATEADRRREIDRIHTQAVGTVVMRICQLFEGMRAELLGEKRRLGYSHKFHIDASVELECHELLASIKASLADDLPIDPTNAVEMEDHFDLLDHDEVKQLGAHVRKTVRELLGVFD